MDIDTITDPFKDFVTIIFQYLPRVLYAAILILVVWLLARLLRAVVSRLLRAAKIDERIDKESTATRQRFPVADNASRVAYWLVWLLSLPVLLGVLGFSGLLDPVQGMISEILAAVPNIFAAGVVLVIAYFVGNLLAKLITSFLTRAGFNGVPVRLGLTKEVAEGRWTPSSIVGYIVLIAIMLFGLMMAAKLLNFATVNELISDFTRFFARILWGLVILGIGIFLAGLVAKIVQASGRANAGALATFAQVAIIVMAGALALRAMGFANDIILLGFGLSLAAIAVAVALAFGLGGREVARDQLDRWAKSMRGEKADET